MINGTATEELLNAMEKLQDAYQDLLKARLAAPKAKVTRDYKMWVDDLYPAPDGWTAFVSVNGALNFICQTILEGDTISMISLDHNAGEYRNYGGDYINLLTTIEDEINTRKDFGGSTIMERFVNNTTFHIHSLNPDSKQNMERVINRNGWNLVPSIKEIEI